MSDTFCDWKEWSFGIMFFRNDHLSPSQGRRGPRCVAAERWPSRSPRGDVALGRRLPPFSKIKQGVSYMVERGMKWAFCQGVMGVCVLNRQRAIRPYFRSLLCTFLKISLSSTQRKVVQEGCLSVDG